MSPDEIENLIKKIINEGVNFPWWLYILVFLSAYFGYFLASYFKKKGENRAINENYESLLNQIKKTTIATENIKTDLASNNWINQQSWFLKEKYYSKLLNEFYKLRQSLSSQLDFYMEPGSEHRDIQINNNKNYIKYNEIGGQAISNIENIQGSSEIVISIRAKEALQKFHTHNWDASFNSSHNKEYLDSVYSSTNDTYSIILEEAKKDLKQT